MWVVPILLIIPNIFLDRTEQSYSWLDRAINVLLPLGVYTMLMACQSKPGKMAVLLFPIMFLCSFQLVLLSLYGESIIAVDMYLNVMTTNPREAGELLENLMPAVAVVCLAYLPPLVIGIVRWAKGSKLSREKRRPALICGACLGSIGLVLMCIGLFSGYKPDRKLFPVNVISNIFEAFRRTELADNYFESSADFRYGATLTRDSLESEIYVLVIGETSRADNWGLNGYDRPTNPRLSRRHGLVTFKKVLSESNTTHKSVPLMISPWDARSFGDSIYNSKSIIQAFNETGYSTAWFSNQQRNHSLIDFFGECAHTCEFLEDDGIKHYDGELCTRLRRFIQDNKSKIFAVLHTYGSHFSYTERYPQKYAFFPDDGSTEASPSNRPALINAYDNSIRYVDAVLDSVAGILEESGRNAAMVYVADHGEDIFDDGRERFLHASPTPTYWQLHVPMIIWMSDTYRHTHPDKYEAAVANSGKNISSSRSAFHTLLSLSGIETPYYSPEGAITEDCYTEPRRLYLDDYNDAIDLQHSGLRESDFAQLSKARITY